jgi:hypothetical protein
LNPFGISFRARMPLLLLLTGLACSPGATRSQTTTDHASSDDRVIARVRRATNRSAGQTARLISDGVGFHRVDPAGLNATAPRLASGALTIELERSFSMAIEPIDLADVEGHIVDGAILYGDAAIDTDVVIALDSEGPEELRLLRSERAPSLTRWRIHGDAIAMARAVAGHLELVDRAGKVRLATEPIVAVDAVGQRRLAALTVTRQDGDGWLVEARFDLRGLAYPIVLDPAWTTIAPLPGARAGHSAVLLTTGKVLVAGGVDSTGATYGEGVVFDPTTATWTKTGPNTYPPGWGGLAALPAGRAIALGGYASGRAEIYDSATNTWTETAPLKVPHGDAHPVVLASGKVLVAGGAAPPDERSAEVYDPTTNSWSLVAAAGHYHGSPFSLRLADGRVLVAGETDAVVEIYDPIADTWTDAAPMNESHDGGASVLLPSGKALIVGGAGTPPLPSKTTAETYDPATNTWTLVGSLSEPRADFQLTVLSTGKVLATGGIAYGRPPYDDAELFDAVSNVWLNAGKMHARRRDHTATLLPSGDVLIAGGLDTIFSSATASAELFTQGAIAASCTSPFDCRSGFCADVRCCNVACIGPCEACDVVGAEGTCTNLAVDDVPRSSHPNCGKFKCGAAGACRTTCVVDGDCVSAHCSDGVCCDVACTGVCEACDVAEHVGTCSPVIGAPHGARSPCAGGGEVCATRACDGKDVAKCTVSLVVATTPCAGAACIGSVFHASSACDGKGTCVAGATTDCAPFACAVSGCLHRCASDAECAPGFRCNAGYCVPRLECTTDGECEAGHVCSSGGHCEPSPPPPSDGGVDGGGVDVGKDGSGCACSHRELGVDSRLGVFGGVGLLAFLSLRRRRRQKPTTRS